MKEPNLDNLCGKILNQLEVAHFSTKHIAISMLAQIQIYIGGDLRISWQRVPHLLFPDKDKPQYSIAYFKKSKMFRVFYPYPSGNIKQNKKDFTHYIQVINYLTDN